MRKILKTLPLMALFIVLAASLGQSAIQMDQSQFFDVGLRPSHITSGDINGDGYPDLVISNMFSHSVSIAYNNGAGEFNTVEEIEYQNDKKHPTSVATGDLDGDGDIDIVTSQIQQILSASQPFQNVGMILLYNQGDGTFEQVWFPFDGNPSMSVVANITGDKNPDLIIGDNGALSFEAQLVGQFEPGITIYENQGNRKFIEKQNIITDGSVVYLNYTDYDDDGFNDLIALSQGVITINELFQIEFKDRAIYIHKGSELGIPTEPSQTIALTQSPYTSQMANFAGNEKKELAVSFVGIMDQTELTGEDAYFGIYQPDESNTFSELTTNPIPGVGYQIFMNDYDLDEDLDICITAEKIIPLTEGKEYEPYVLFYENDGDNNFIHNEDEHLFNVDRLPRYAVSQDFDLDGDVDVATLCSIKDAAEFGTSLPGKVYIFLNQARESSVPNWFLH
jgi:hypothetical protein